MSPRKRLRKHPSGCLALVSLAASLALAGGSTTSQAAPGADVSPRLEALVSGAAAPDDTHSGDTCAGYQHPPSPANDCSAGAGTQPSSLGPFSSRGPSGDMWLRPDLSAPGYNIVSAQAATGASLAQTT